jgi:hypothetical protein
MSFSSNEFAKILENPSQTSANMEAAVENMLYNPVFIIDFWATMINLSVARIFCYFFR